MTLGHMLTFPWKGSFTRDAIQEESECLADSLIQSFDDFLMIVFHWSRFSIASISELKFFGPSVIQDIIQRIAVILFFLNDLS